MSWAWREAGLGAPDDIEQLKRRITELELQVIELIGQLEERSGGPSNIGNYLAGLRIPATAGFGVDHVGLHATDERCRIDTIPIVQAVYQQAVSVLLRGER